MARINKQLNVTVLEDSELFQVDEAFVNEDGHVVVQLSNPDGSYGAPISIGITYYDGDTEMRAPITLATVKQDEPGALPPQ